MRGQLGRSLHSAVHGCVVCIDINIHDVYGCIKCVGYVGDIHHVRTHRRCTGRRQSFHGHVSTQYTALSNEHVANADHIPDHG